MLQVDHITYRYQKNKEPVIKDISFSVAPGTIVSLIGANGSGKSTLLKNIAQLIVDEGQVFIDDERITPKNRHHHISYLPQNSSCSARLTVFEIILLGCISKLGVHVSDENMRRVQEIIDHMHLHDLANKYIHELSGGQQQLVFIAQTLIRDNPILLLDEPISALDIHRQFELMEIIRDVTKKQSLRTIVVLHHLDMAAKFSDKMIVLANGQIYGEGLPKDVLIPTMIEDVYKVKSTIFYDETGMPHVIPLNAIKEYK